MPNDLEFLKSYFLITPLSLRLQISAIERCACSYKFGKICIKFPFLKSLNNIFTYLQSTTTYFYLLFLWDSLLFFTL